MLHSNMHIFSIFYLKTWWQEMRRDPHVAMYQFPWPCLAPTLYFYWTKDIRTGPTLSSEVRFMSKGTTNQKPIAKKHIQHPPPSPPYRNKTNTNVKNNGKIRKNYIKLIIWTPPQQRISPHLNTKPKEETNGHVAHGNFHHVDLVKVRSCSLQ